jgi:DNA-binding GntR family transcriptional regulator
LDPGRYQTRAENGGARRVSEQRKPLTDLVYESLRDEILRAEWAPGDIVVEADLAEKYDVSKTPVREALRRLVQDGWVTLIARKGCIVRPLGLDDVREIFALRLMLEPQLAAEAARKSHQTEIDRVTELVSHHREMTSNLEDALLHLQQFHLTIAELSGNGRVVRFLSGLFDEVRRMHYLMPELEASIRWESEVQAHELIVEALSARDAELVARRMREHLLESAQKMVAIFGGLTAEDYPLLDIADSPTAS